MANIPPNKRGWCVMVNAGRLLSILTLFDMNTLAIMAAVGIMAIVGWIAAPGSFDLTYWPNYVIIAATAIGVLGFSWLIFTYKRYD